jgi:hypothetical protein
MALLGKCGKIPAVSTGVADFCGVEESDGTAQREEKRNINSAAGANL